jgi:hypothetical protein
MNTGSLPTGLPALGALPLPVRALCSCFLLTIGIGYLAAMTYLFLLDVQPHWDMRMSTVEGLGMKYYGARGTTRLEAALRGPMADKLTDAERETLLGWIQEGASEPAYALVQPIVGAKCLACHGGSGPLPSLASYGELTKFTGVDARPSPAMLARVSHVHLFGLSIIFLLTGAIFALSQMSTGWRTALIVVPFVAIWVDIGSWWLARQAPVFAYTVLIGGAAMGVALAAQILIALMQMWRPRLRGTALAAKRIES